MKHFVVVQDSVDDDEPVIHGPFNNLKAAKHHAEANFDANDGWIYSILAQGNHHSFRQVSQAVCVNPAFPWKDSR